MYWDRVFEVSFVTPELEAEYQRRYGQFLYTIGGFVKGQTAFEKSLALPNNSNYVLIALLYGWLGYGVFTSNSGSLVAYLIRFVGTTGFAFLIISVINVIKNKQFVSNE